MIINNFENYQLEAFKEKVELKIYELCIKHNINPIKAAGDIKELVTQGALVYKWKNDGEALLLHVYYTPNDSFSLKTYTLNKRDNDNADIIITIEEGDCYYDEDGYCDDWHTEVNKYCFESNLKLLSQYSKTNGKYEESNTEYEVVYQSDDVKVRKKTKEKENEINEQIKVLTQELNGLKQKQAVEDEELPF